MKKFFYKLLLAVAILFTSGLQVNAKTTVPVISTAGNETWYLIKCNPRDPNNRLKTWITVDSNDTLRYTPYSAADDQLWKVVANGTGVALVNKKNGRFIYVPQGIFSLILSSPS